MGNRFFTFCCLRHFSYFSDFAALFLGALEQLKYQPAVDHPELSECRDGNVGWFQTTGAPGRRPAAEGAASARRRWRSSCANSRGVPFVSRQSPYKAERQQKCWYLVVHPGLSFFLSKNRKHRGINNTRKTNPSSLQ